MLARLGEATNFTYGWPTLLLALPGAWLVGRFGPRRVALYGLPVTVVGYLILIGAELVNWVMYLSIALLTVGAVGGFTSVPAATLNNWFHWRKATAMAVPLLGFALWRFAINPVSGFLVGVLGWRFAAAAVGAAALAMAMPLAWQIRDRPEDQDLYPDGMRPDPDAVLPDYTSREAIRSRSFWLLMVGDGCLLSVSMASLLLTGLNEFRVDSQWGEFQVDTVPLVVSTAAILVCALISDRFPVRYVLAGLMLILAAALIMLATGTPVSRFMFEILAGIALGGGPAVRIAARGTYFGRKRFATIAATGLLLVQPFQTVTIFSLLNLYELTGGTTIPLLAALLGCLIGAWGYLLAGPPQLAPSQWSPAEG